MTEQIVPITLTQALPILTEAFAQDPAFAYFTHPLAPKARSTFYPSIVEWIARLHVLSGQPVYGWQVGGQITGCALVEDHKAPLRQTFAFLRLLPAGLRLSMPVLRRLNTYATLSGRKRPAGVTHFLVLLGVADHARGQGHGARFLQALHRQSGPAAHWALDTENPANPRFYARLGYHLYATEALGDAEMFKLHRPPVAAGQDENQP